MRIAITIEYDGKNYLGWQKNGENKSVCGEIERAFKAVCLTDVKVVGSGRTDAGVHAYAQVAHCDIPKSSEISIKNLQKLLNRELPSDIKILSLKQVSDKFHARYNVKSKTYLYKCYTGVVQSPLRRDGFAHYPAVLNGELMKKVAKTLTGKHNFKAFCLSSTDSESFEREIISIDIVRKKEELYFYVKGKGFLYSMVRILVGTLLLVGQNKLTEEDVVKALTTGDKSLVGEKMPAHALYLLEVEY